MLCFDTDDYDMFKNSFDLLDQNKDGFLCLEDFTQATKSIDAHLLPSVGKAVGTVERLKTRLFELQKPSNSLQQVSFEKFKQECANVPYIKGHRIEWARSLHLDILLAQKLRPGLLWDELHGIKGMDMKEIQDCCQQFAQEVFSIVMERKSSMNESIAKIAHGTRPVTSGVKWAQSRNDTLGYDVEWDVARLTMNKFKEELGSSVEKFTGTYGSKSLFHEGLEAELGIADPFVLRAILHENVQADGSDQGFMTSNYKLFTSPCLEFARVLGNPADYCGDVPSFLLHKERLDGQASGIGYPAEAEVRSCSTTFSTLRRLYTEVKNSHSGLFPGDIGKDVLESEALFKICLQSEDSEVSVKNLVQAAFSSFVATEAILLGDSMARQCLCGAMLSFPPATVCQGDQTQELNVLVTIQFDSIARNADKEEKLNTLKGMMLSVNENLRFHSCKNMRYVYCKYENANSLRTELKIDETPNRMFKLADIEFTSFYIEKEGLFPRADELISGHAILENFKRESKFLAESMITRRQGRRHVRLEELMQNDEVMRAKLRVEECLMLYQYTGPMFQLWNSVLRCMPFPKNYSKNKFTTSIHTLVSGVVKMSRITKLPSARKVFRGLGGILLDDKWFVNDERGVKGAVELGFLSTTLKKDVALSYSGVKVERGTIFEIDVGAIDCGAQLDSISQYPGEGELLFPPLSNLEAIGTKIEAFEGAQVLVVKLKINVNLKSCVIEDLIGKRKIVMQSLANNLCDTLALDLRALKLRWIGEPKIRDFVCKLQENVREVTANQHNGVWFNTDINVLRFLQNLLIAKNQVVLEAMALWKVHRIADYKLEMNKAMRYMAACDRPDLVALLNFRGARLWSVDDDGRSLLHIACQNGCGEVMVDLIDKKRLVNHYLVLKLFGVLLMHSMLLGFIFSGVICAMEHPVCAGFVSVINLNVTAQGGKSQQLRNARLSLMPYHETLHFHNDTFLKSATVTAGLEEVKMKTMQDISISFLISSFVILVACVLNVRSPWLYLLGIGRDNADGFLHRMFIQQQSFYEIMCLNFRARDKHGKTPAEYALEQGDNRILDQLRTIGAVPAFRTRVIQSDNQA